MMMGKVTGRVIGRWRWRWRGRGRGRGRWIGCLPIHQPFLSDRDDPDAAKNVNRAIEGMLQLLDDYKCMRACTTSNSSRQHQHAHHPASSASSHSAAAHHTVGAATRDPPSMQEVVSSDALEQLLSLQAGAHEAIVQSQSGKGKRQNPSQNGKTQGRAHKRRKEPPTKWNNGAAAPAAVAQSPVKGSQQQFSAAGEPEIDSIYGQISETILCDPSFARMLESTDWLDAVANEAPDSDFCSQFAETINQSLIGTGAIEPPSGETTPPPEGGGREGDNSGLGGEGGRGREGSGRGEEERLAGEEGGGGAGGGGGGGGGAEGGHDAACNASGAAQNTSDTRELANHASDGRAGELATSTSSSAGAVGGGGVCASSGSANRRVDFMPAPPPVSRKAEGSQPVESKKTLTEGAAGGAGCGVSAADVQLDRFLQSHADIDKFVHAMHRKGQSSKGGEAP
jgi:hypothetical protein